jgi:hypothetical protein
MMILANETTTPRVSIKFKHKSGRYYATAVFNTAACLLFDKNHPYRSSISVYVDEGTGDIGFRIVTTMGKKPIHYNSVGITKAARTLHVRKQKLHVELKWDMKQMMYVAKIGQPNESTKRTTD